VFPNTDGLASYFIYPPRLLNGPAARRRNTSLENVPRARRPRAEAELRDREQVARAVRAVRTLRRTRAGADPGIDDDGDRRVEEGLLERGRVREDVLPASLLSARTGRWQAGARTHRRCPTSTGTARARAREAPARDANTSCGLCPRRTSPSGGALVPRQREPGEGRGLGRTIPERGEHRHERGVEDVPVVVDTRRVDVEHPGSLARRDRKRLGRERARSAPQGQMGGRDDVGKCTDPTRTSCSRSESTCASSLGGPGLKRGEQSAGKSMFGTDARE
jgi:hypothetical protein